MWDQPLSAGGAGFVGATPPMMVLSPRMGGTYATFGNTGGGGGSWSKQANSNTLTWYGMLSAVTNDFIEFNMWLEAASYEIDGAAFRGANTSFGIASVTLDGGQAFDWDQSGADPGTPLYYGKIGTFTVGSAGMHKIRLTNSGRSSGTGHNVSLHSFVLRGPCTGQIQWPMGDVPCVINPSSAFPGNYRSWTLYSPEFLDFAISGSGAQAATSRTIVNIITTLFDLTTHATGTYIEGPVYLPAGTYAFDTQALIGTIMGVMELHVNGTAVGTPQAANTIRDGGIGGAASNPGNGNLSGGALGTGQYDLFDTLVGTGAGPVDGGLGQDGVVPNALTGIVIPTGGWQTVRQTVVGGNSAMVANKFDIAVAGWFRRTA